MVDKNGCKFSIASPSVGRGYVSSPWILGSETFFGLQKWSYACSWPIFKRPCRESNWLDSHLLSSWIHCWVRDKPILYSRFSYLMVKCGRSMNVDPLLQCFNLCLWLQCSLLAWQKYCQNCATIWNSFHLNFLPFFSFAGGRPSMASFLFLLHRHFS